MDLTTMTDEELDALQIAVNVEIGARIKKTRAAARIASAMESATTIGLSANDIQATVQEACGLAKVPVIETVYTEPVKKTSAWRGTPPAKRSNGGFRARTIDTTLNLSPGDTNGAG